MCWSWKMNRSLPATCKKGAGRKVQQRMFDRFWGSDSARARSGDRFGLGLAIVRAVAGMHGGRVFVQCEDGHNRVGLTLPMDARAEA